MLSENGATNPATTIPVETVKFEEYFRYVVRGLANYHWSAFLPTACKIEIWAFTASGSRHFSNNVFRLNSENHVFNNLGVGTVIYEGKQAVDLEQMTIWSFHFYGGIMLGGDPERSEYTSREIGAISRPAELNET